MPLEPLTIAEREAFLLAPYAMHSRDSAGRKHSESAHPYRGPFQRDRDRILHSAAFRRLGYKTQVFTGELGDYHRSRLTHTLEVASIARTLARALRLNEDLVEAMAFMHDIGHPPFGHAGEDALAECLHGHGGFSHNRQALRIAEELERRYPGFPGLNLTQEVLAGQQSRTEKAAAVERPLFEAQVVDAADSIAYDTHDADDALELGLLTLDELLEVPLWAEAADRVLTRYADLSGSELRRAVLHELIDWQVGDLLQRAEVRIARGDLISAAAVRTAEPLLVFATEIADMKHDLERFLYTRVYRHPQVLAMRTEAQGMLRTLFDRYVAEPTLLPGGFYKRIALAGLPRTVGDYLAGMTDRYLNQQHERLAQ